VAASLATALFDRCKPLCYKGFGDVGGFILRSRPERNNRKKIIGAMSRTHAS
jgi:hypothetical protein